MTREISLDARITAHRDPMRRERPDFSTKGRFPSQKTQRAVAFRRSLRQLDYLRLLEVNPDVTWFLERPFLISYRDAGRSVTWTPDFLVTRRGRDILVAVGGPPRAPETHAALDLRLDVARQLDFAFEKVDAAEIGREPRLSNARYLLLALRHRVAPDVHAALIDCLIRAPRTLADLESRKLSPSLRLDVFALCLGGEAMLDLDRPIDHASIVRARGRAR